jgi:hypothetical protein
MRSIRSARVLSRITRCRAHRPRDLRGECSERATADNNHHPSARRHATALDGVQSDRDVVAEGAVVPVELRGQRVQRFDRDGGLFGQSAWHAEPEVRPLSMRP